MKREKRKRGSLNLVFYSPETVQTNRCYGRPRVKTLHNTPHRLENLFCQYVHNV